MNLVSQARDRWPEVLIVAILLLAAFTVPILGPLRASGARMIVAVAVLLIGAGLALLVDRGGVPQQERSEETVAPE
jgi:protein-S-isoprenylcysteine O-methyltransferase Ste14